MLRRGLYLFKKYVETFGVRGIYFFIKLYVISSLLNTTISMEILGYPEPLYIRSKTSDRAIFTQIFVEEEYQIPFKDRNLKIIVDGGANVGFASIYFSQQFPDANIFAVEPEKSNYIMMLENTHKYPHVVPIQAALWNKNCDLYIKNENVPKWAIQVTEHPCSETRRIEGLTITKLLEKHIESDHIDILKLDVEGSEREIFESNYQDWIDKIGSILIELHDRFEYGTSEPFLNVAETHGFHLIKQKGPIFFYAHKSQEKI